MDTLVSRFKTTHILSGIYIHIPFCKQACHYCDFHFSTSLKTKEQFLQAIVREIELQKDYLETKEIRTLYLGGGTPSLLEVEELEVILAQINKYFSLSKNIEFTLEANPDDLTPGKLNELKQIGVNRLSIGIQTFNDGFLNFFNRAHDSQIAKGCVPKARTAGFENISIDLIFGIPNQSLEDLESDLSMAIGLDPDHISIYGLTIEEKTAFGNWYKKGKLVPLEEEAAAQQFEMIMTRLKENGYDQYEISNFAKPGFESRHNSSYWTGGKYLGLGPSAHSFNGSSRQFNVSNNMTYIRSLNENKIPATVEKLTATDQINDALLTRLRTARGLDLRWLEEKFQFDLERERSKELNQFLDSDKVYIEDNILRFTDSGKLLADLIIEKLFI